MIRRATAAFTLVELLVVISIIVVLLALLMPALSQATYQATLAVCGTNLHANQVSITTYAFDHKRYYPNRKMMNHGTDVDPIKITGANPAVDYDDRIQLKGYIQLNKTMTCPLTDRLDLEIDPASDTFVYTSYAFWWGWRYAYATVSRQGLYKLGDRFEDDRGKTHTVLAGDHIHTNPPSLFFFSTHPEKKRQHIPRVQQRGENPFGPQTGVPAGSFVTLSWHESIYRPSSFDLNFVMAEGSVVPVRNFKVGTNDDQGLEFIPTFKNEFERFQFPRNPVPRG